MRNFLSRLATHLMLLLLAAALWWYATDKRTAHVRGLRVPIRVSFGEGLILVRQTPAFARFSIRGPRGVVERALTAARRGEAQAVVNLATDVGDVEGEKAFRVALGPESIDGMPAGTQIFDIRPDHVEVTLVRRVMKRLEVAPKIAGEPAPGFQIVGHAYVQPRRVPVWGPKTLLDGAESIATDPIDVSGITEEANRSFPWTVAVKQELTAASGEAVSVRCSETVRIYLTVGRVQGRRVVENVPVKILAPLGYPYVVKLKPERVSLSMSGAQHVLDKLTPADLEVYVNVSALRPAVAPYKQPLVCTLPPDVRLDQDAPTVEVDVSEPKPEGKAPP